MILIDQPRDVEFRRFKRTAHMMSDLPGDEGSIELAAFAAKIGLRAAWLQNRGTPTEHFDLFDGAIQRAISAGATVVEGRELVSRCVTPKRRRQ